MKKKTYSLLVLFYISSLWVPSQAYVNMKNGSYVESWIDFVDPRPGFEMKVERVYSSRSLFTGLFGFGWCSGFETHLNITSDGILNLVECGGGLEVTYYPQKFELKSTEQTIQLIVDKYLDDKKIRPSQIANLKAQLRENTKMRFEEANRLFLIDTQRVKNGSNIFIAKTKGVENIFFNGQTYKRTKKNGKVEHFNKKGQLVQITNAGGQWLKIFYKGKKISYLVDKTGRRISFLYNRKGKLSKLFNGKNLQASYRFRGDNLVSVTNIWKKTYTYQYDANHNMTTVVFPDGTQLVMTYDLAKDWIISYSNRIGCREDFAFFLSPTDPKNHYWGTFNRSCDKKLVVKGRHEFWYQTYNFSPDKYLYRAKEEYNQNYYDIYFHAYLGQPISIRERDSYQGFAYTGSGLISKKEQKKYSEKNAIVEWKKYSYSYNKNKVKGILTKWLDGKGKFKKSSLTLYQYSPTGLLVRASQQKKRFVDLTYQKDGKVSSLKDEKGREFILSYTPGTKKPTQIIQKGVGRVLISYNAKGEVDKIKDKGKRKVASSLIEGFIELIQFVGPLGDKLKI